MNLNPKPLTVIQQAQRIREAFPLFDVSMYQNTLTCTWSVRPDPLMREYTVRLVYRGTKAPEVSVLSPLLPDRVKGKPIPHRYAEGHLCLTYLRYREWSRELSLVETFIPWTSEWLLFYETWLATGAWIGGGIHTPARSRMANVFA